jgi:hypothetical protein
VIGTAILYLVPNALLADLASYRLLAYGAVALVIMLAFPDGVVGTLERAARRYRARTRTAGIDFKTVLRESAARRRTQRRRSASRCAAPARPMARWWRSTAST